MNTSNPASSCDDPKDNSGDDWSAPTSPWLCPLSDFRLIRVSGEDAFSFLNNQLTNELKEISQSTAQFSGYCSPKGRLYAIFLAFMRDNDYYLRTTADDALVERLRLFVLRSRVTLALYTALRGIGLIGAGAARLLDEAALPAPADVLEVASHGEYTVVRSPGICERYGIYAPDDGIAALRERLTSATTGADSGIWRLHDILAGLPNIYAQTSELFVPQMVNLDLTDALSFSKGCYPGQEVVARMHYLGKIKRRMYRFALPAPVAVPDKGPDNGPGDAVFVPNYSTEQPSGEIVDAYTLPDGSLQGLASLRVRGLEQGELRLGAPDGAVGHIQPLPYEITAATDTDDTP